MTDESYDSRPVSGLGDLVDVCTLEENFSLLPICHTTSLEAVRAMLKNNKMSPHSFDEAFQESLLFFFYGRARYIPQDAVKDVYSRANPPIAFVYDLESLNILPKRLVAFDSGGFERFNIKRPLSDFTVSLGTKSEEIKKYIKQLYTENENYLGKILTIDTVDYPWCTPLEWLKSLYRSQEDMMEKEYGEQAYTTEIHYDRDVDLDPIMIILPSRFGASLGAIAQTKQAFNIKDDEWDKKIILYNENETVIHNYFYIVNEVKKQMSDFLKQKDKTS